MLGFVALALSAVGFLFPEFMPGNGSALFGIIILTCTLFCWRGAYCWLVKQPQFLQGQGFTFWERASSRESDW